jgi:hypothetical protein
LADCNLWFNHTKNFQINPFEKFDRSLGSLGWIPKILPDLLSKWGCESDKAVRSCINEIFMVTMKNIYHKYKDRWSRLDSILNIKEKSKEVKRVFKRKDI